MTATGPTIPERMRAVVLTELGSLDGIALADVPVPEAGAGEVLIRVGTVGINRQELNLIHGRFRVGGLALPHVLGLDPTGVVVAAGADAGTLAVGQRVVVKPAIACDRCQPCLAGDDDACDSVRSVGIHRPGGMAEYVSVPARNVFPIPDGLSFEAATATAHSFPVARTLALRMGLTVDDTVLVTGAAGAIGGAVVQLARLEGATVVALSTGPDARERLETSPERLRPDVRIDLAETPAFAESLRERLPDGVSLHVETASDPAVWSEALTTLRRGARVAVIGAHAGPRVEIDNNWLFRQRVTIVGTSNSSRAAFAEMVDLAGAGALVPPIDSVVPFADGPAAYGRVKARQNHGKIVLRVADDIE